MYEVPYADKSKGMRSTNLRDARKMKLVPSYSTVASVIHKPALMDWKINHYLDAVYKHKAKSREEAIRVAEELMSRARDAGSVYHEIIEHMCRFDGEWPPDINDEHAIRTCNLAYEWLLDNGIEPVEIEWPFAHPLGYGGRIDLIGDMSGTTIILDWKSQDKPADELKAWDDYCVQLAAYAEGRNMWHQHYRVEDVKLVSVLLSQQDEAISAHWWTDNDYTNSWRKFCAMLELWKLVKNYQSGWSDV